jgi:hypothetical protein
LDTLNQAIKNQESFIIHEKNPEYYRQISKQYCKHKTLMKHYKSNPSFKVFIEELENRNIVIDLEDDW